MGASVEPRQLLSSKIENSVEQIIRIFEQLVPNSAICIHIQWIFEDK